MPQTCTICRHPQRAEIERQLAAGFVLRAIAAQHGTTATTLARHRDGCLAGAIATARATGALTAARTILEQVQDLQRETIDILRGAKREGRYTSAVLAIAAALKNLELQAKLTGELDDRPINLFILPQWTIVESALVRILRPEQVQELRDALATIE